MPLATLIMPPTPPAAPPDAANLTVATLAALALNLKRLRTGRGLSQVDLAARAGIRPGYVSMLERGQRTPRLDTLCALAAALNVDPTALLATGARR